MTSKEPGVATNMGSGPCETAHGNRSSGGMGYLGQNKPAPVCSAPQAAHVPPADTNPAATWPGRQKTAPPKEQYSNTKVIFLAPISRQSNSPGFFEI